MRPDIGCGDRSDRLDRGKLAVRLSQGGSVGEMCCAPYIPPGERINDAKLAGCCGLELQQALRFSKSCRPPKQCGAFLVASADAVDQGGAEREQRLCLYLARAGVVCQMRGAAKARETRVDRAGRCRGLSRLDQGAGSMADREPGRGGLSVGALFLGSACQGVGGFEPKLAAKQRAARFELALRGRGIPGLRIRADEELVEVFVIAVEFDQAAREWQRVLGAAVRQRSRAASWSAELAAPMSRRRSCESHSSKAGEVSNLMPSKSSRPSPASASASWGVPRTRTFTSTRSEGLRAKAALRTPNTS